MQDISKSIRIITQKAHGTYSGTVIDMMEEVCKVLDRFNHRLTKLENQSCITKNQAADGPEADSSAPVSVPEVPPEVLNGPSNDEVSEPVVSKSKNKTARKAKSGTPSKAKKTPERSI